MLTPAKVRGKKGDNWGFLVRNKVKVIEKLSQHLSKGKLTDKTVYWSGVTDPYAAPPAITNELWKTLLNAPQALRPRRIVIQTRFRPDRDVALIKEYANSTIATDGGPAVLISYSVGTDKNSLISAWEKSTPLFEQRMNAIKTLRQAGLFVVATLSPFGLWNDLSGTLTQFKIWGVAYITCLFLKENTRSSNTPSLFLDFVRKTNPILLNPQWQRERIQEMKDIYGNHLVLVGQNGFESLATPLSITQNDM